MKRLRIAAERGIGRIVEVAWSLIAGEQHAERRPPLLAGHLHAVLRIDDGARVDEGYWTTDREDAGALEEERAEFGIEQREPLVGFDLRLVGFHLREVGVQREVRRHVRGDAVLDVDPRVGVGIPGGEAAGRFFDRSELHGGEGRQELEIAAGRQVGHAFEEPHLPVETRFVARHRRPDGVLFVLALDFANDLHSPAVRLTRTSPRIAKALERNRHLRGVAVIDDLRAGIEQRVP